MHRIRRIFPNTPSEGIAFAAVAVVLAALLVALLLGNTHMGLACVGALTALAIAMLIELRRRIVQLRNRVGEGFSLHAATVHQSSNDGAGDIAHRRTLATIEQSRLESTERHLAVLASIQQLREQIESISQTTRNDK